MTNKLNAFFGSSLVSAYWNGAATYYRGIIRALYGRGHHVTFFEPDAYERQAHRDMADPHWAQVVVYPADEGGVQRALDQAQGADVIVKASGVGVFDELLEAAVPALGRADSVKVFWDVDAPATLARMEADIDDTLRAQIPNYDLVLTYGGGDPVVRRYRALGARDCVPIYNAVDPCTHFPAPADARFSADLGFVGNRLPDREARVEKFFLAAAAPVQLPHAGVDPALRPLSLVHGRTHAEDIGRTLRFTLRAPLVLRRRSRAACAATRDRALGPGLSRYLCGRPSAHLDATAHRARASLGARTLHGRGAVLSTRDRVA